MISSGGQLSVLQALPPPQQAQPQVAVPGWPGREVICGIAIGSPILFRNELASGKLIPAHDFVAADGRSFWLAYPVARQNSRKIARFSEWLCDEAASDRSEARAFIRSAVAVEP